MGHPGRLRTAHRDVERPERQRRPRHRRPLRQDHRVLALWYVGRALCESITSHTWRFTIAADPFPAPGATPTAPRNSPSDCWA
ncbi:hypothetical protein AB0B94_29000 [Micromonospora sp. NPDC048986]|uniref:hypothetical protein n=1 Tax=Micromonospora sp. NPDC048986 TaxID=3155644 RepID=UPI0033D2E992